MANPTRNVLSGFGFYATLAVCLLAVGAGGWLLLFGGGGTPEESSPALAPEALAEEPAVSGTSGTAAGTAGTSETAGTATTATTAETPPVTVDTPAGAIRTGQAAAAMPEDGEAASAAGTEAVPETSTPARSACAPLEGEVVAAFSMDALVYNATLQDWRTHDGVDIAAPEGTEVLAARDGTVVSVVSDAMMGVTVTVDHGDGTSAVYANLQAGPLVAQGEVVMAGEAIGAVGSAGAAEAALGSHLHFAVTRDGTAVNPVEYLPFLA